MSALNYELLEDYKWYGTFFFTKEDVQYRASGILEYNLKSGIFAEVLFDAWHEWLMPQAGIFGFLDDCPIVYANLVNLEKNKESLLGTLLNCSLRIKQIGTAPPRFYLYARFALLSKTSCLELNTENINCIQAEYNTWPEFNFSQHDVSKCTPSAQVGQIERHC